MLLECLKFNETMPAEDPCCRHPDDYCKFRTSCIIYFIEKENKRSRGPRTETGNEEDPGSAPVNNDKT